jgi:hypothetical protein
MGQVLITAWTRGIQDKPGSVGEAFCCGSVLSGCPACGAAWAKPGANDPNGE